MPNVKLHICKPREQHKPRLKLYKWSLGPNTQSLLVKENLMPILVLSIASKTFMPKQKKLPIQRTKKKELNGSGQVRSIHRPSNTMYLQPVQVQISWICINIPVFFKSEKYRQSTFIQLLSKRLRLE